VATEDFGGGRRGSGGIYGWEQEGGGVGASWWDQERRKGYGIGLGKIATVWDGEVAGLRGALTHAPAKKILILSDSQAGRTGKARTYNLRWVASEIGRRKEELGEDAVTLGWVKAHVGIYGNEKADRLAKEGAEKTPNTTRITEGGLKQVWAKKRKAERCVKGTGSGRVLKWNRKALLNYTQCRTGKGRLGWWRYTLDPWEDPMCRVCFNLETGRHVALVCTAGEWLGRRWSSWKQADDRKVWMRKRKDGDKEVVIDLVEDFFTRLDLRAL